MICLSLPVYYHLEFSTDSSTALVTWDRSGSECGQVKSALTAAHCTQEMYKDKLDFYILALWIVHFR